jgi:lysine 2,3-aminomutase
MHTLLSRLLEIRVRPYYLYHCDNAVGISHFVTTLEAGLDLMEALKGYFTGFGVPEYVITTPLGKIPLGESGLHHDEKGYWVHNYEGKTMSLDEFLPFAEDEKVAVQEEDA